MRKLLRPIIIYFDKLEDQIRIRLSHKPILYAIVGGVGIVLFWKGVWETAELVPVLHGPGSIVVGTLILMLSGLMVSFFIGDSIILSGFRKEKKLVEKTEAEVAMEKVSMDYVVAELDHIEEELNELKKGKDTSHRKIPL